MSCKHRAPWGAIAAALALLLGGHALAADTAGTGSTPAGGAATAARVVPGAPDSTLLAAATAEQAAPGKTLQRLVEIETGTGNAEGMAAMADFLEGELRALGATVSRHKPDAGVAGENIVGRIPG